MAFVGRGDEARGGGAMVGSGPIASMGIGGEGSGGATGAPFMWTWDRSRETISQVSNLPLLIANSRYRFDFQQWS